MAAPDHAIAGVRAYAITCPRCGSAGSVDVITLLLPIVLVCTRCDHGLEVDVEDIRDAARNLLQLDRCIALGQLGAKRQVRHEDGE